MMPKYQIGDHVNSWNSGLPYIIKEIVTLDMVGTYAYRVRRLKAGQEWGPTRIYGETAFAETARGPRGGFHKATDEDNMAAKQAFIGSVFMGTD